MSGFQRVVRPWINPRVLARGQEVCVAKFMFVFRGGAFVQQGLSPAELGAHLQKWTTWVGALAKSGVHEGGYAVQGAGKTVRGTRKAITDGPYAEAKDLVTGNLIVLAPSLDEATTIAMGCPIFEFDGSVEVRPILEREAS
jgi:hypothetical protein